MLLLNQVTNSTGGVLEDGPGIHQEGDDGTTGRGLILLTIQMGVQIRMQVRNKDRT